MAFAQETTTTSTSTATVSSNETSTDDSSNSAMSDYLSTLPSSTIRNAYLLIRLQNYIGQSQQNYNSLEDKMEDTRASIEENRAAIASLKGQVAQLDGMATETQEKITNVEIQIAGKEQDIIETLEALEFNQVQLESQKDALSSYLLLLYFEKNLYYDDLNQAQDIKILFQNDTASKVLQNGTYISFLETQAVEMVSALETAKRKIKQQNYELLVKRNQLNSLKESLNGEYRNLAAELEGKENLLKETENSDEIYRELFASYKEAEDAILNEINLYQTNIDALTDRITVDVLSPDQLAVLNQINSDSGTTFLNSEAADFLQLDWPVSPEMGLTAYFDDQGYIATFGMVHHAMDVRIPQGSVIYAPADGVVYLVNDTAASSDAKTRLGYGYIIIAHEKGVMTLYGHISAALVRQGDFVQRGQMIALTGGTPGTPGAGGQTTGAHLHFEVLQNGVRVDPLEYLPLDEVPFDSLPEKYLSLLQTQLENALEEENVNPADVTEENIEAFEETIQDSLPDIVTDEINQSDFWTQGVK
ncbi:MAG: peptidoglycan DD-metalloendopeptidase family protein [Candidatus Gracilibacteria bacterium]